MISEQVILRGFELIVSAANAGERAPTNRHSANPTGKLRSGITQALIKNGMIRVEVYGKNWRVIEILKGPHAGKRTKMPPDPRSKPYKVLPSVFL